jgi:putative ABC transport system permease protein
VHLFRAFILRRLRQEPVRLLLTISGIALGVAVVVGIRLANASSVRGFATALEAMAGAASLEISGPGGLEEQRIPELAWLRDLGDVAPVIEADAAAEIGTASESVRVLGIDILRDRALREYRLTGVDSGRVEPLEILRLLTATDAVILPSAFAGRHRLRAGDRVTLVTGSVRRAFRVVALLTPPADRVDAGGSFAIMDIATAQWAFDRLGWIDRLELRLHEGVQVPGAERAIAARLPHGLAVARPSRRGEQVERMLRAFQFNISALSYVALLVGLFLIHNTIVTSVIARRAEIGVLRGLGIPRQRVVALFLGEAATLAAAGTAAGLAAGTLLAHAAVRLTARTVETLYVAGGARVALPGWEEGLLAVGLGCGLSLVAAIAPAVEASRVPPIAAIGGADRVSGAERRTPRSLGAALALFALAALFARLEPVNGLPLFGFAAAVAIVFGTAFAAPAALRATALVLRWPVRGLFGVSGMLAHASLTSGVRRLSVSTAALAASVAMLVAIAVMIGSFRATVIYWLERTLRADLYVSAGGRTGLSTPSAVPASVEAAISSHPAVAGIERYRSTSLTFENRPIVLAATDYDAIRARRTVLFKEPDDPDAALHGVNPRASVLVSEPLALHHRLRAGDRLVLDTPRGGRPFDIAAVYYDYTTDRGVVLMDWAVFMDLFGEARPTGLSVFLKPGISDAAVRDELTRLLDARHRLYIHTSRTLREQALRTFDRTFAVAYALEVIAIVVAMFGVAATLITLIAERSRELRILRLLGTARAQMRRMVLLEAGILAVLSQILGLGAGTALAVLLVDVINVQSFGWTIQYAVPWTFLLQASAALLVAACVAGLYPAGIAAAASPNLKDEE